MGLWTMTVLHNDPASTQFQCPRARGMVTGAGCLYDEAEPHEAALHLAPAWRVVYVDDGPPCSRSC